MIACRLSRPCFQAAACAAAFLSLVVTSSAESGTIELTPAMTTCVTDDNWNLSAAEVLAQVQTCFAASSDPLELLYKADVGDSNDDGTFGSSYDTLFTNTSSDPQDATILYLGGTFMDCSACYLVVKDGKNSPAQYFFDVSSWNGTDTIQLTGFWPGQGAISNVAIWGQATPVPEPGSLLLVGTAFSLGALRQRRRRV
jgi:hypothetical protein